MATPLKEAWNGTARTTPGSGNAVGINANATLRPLYANLIGSTRGLYNDTGYIRLGPGLYRVHIPVKCQALNLVSVLWKQMLNASTICSGTATPHEQPMPLNHADWVGNTHPSDEALSCPDSWSVVTSKGAHQFTFRVDWITTVLPVANCNSFHLVTETWDGVAWVLEQDSGMAMQPAPFGNSFEKTIVLRASRTYGHPIVRVRAYVHVTDTTIQEAVNVAEVRVQPLSTGAFGLYGNTPQVTMTTEPSGPPVLTQNGTSRVLPPIGGETWIDTDGYLSVPYGQSTRVVVQFNGANTAEVTPPAGCGHVEDMPLTVSLGACSYERLD